MSLFPCAPVPQDAAAGLSQCLTHNATPWSPCLTLPLRRANLGPLSPKSAVGPRCHPSPPQIPFLLCKLCSTAPALQHPPVLLSGPLSQGLAPQMVPAGSWRQLGTRPAGEGHTWAAAAAATLLPGWPHSSALPARLRREQPGCGDGSMLPGIPRQALARALLRYVQPGTEMGREPPREAGINEVVINEPG